MKKLKMLEDNIDNLMCPANMIVKNDGDFITTQIVDVEIDPFDVVYDSGCAKIITENTSYVTLTKENLEFLLDFIRYGNEYSEKSYNELLLKMKKNE